jgi:hypothetical protein
MGCGEILNAKVSTKTVWQPQEGTDGFHETLIELLTLSWIPV